MAGIFINGISCISAQPTLSDNFFENFSVDQTSTMKKAIEPNYKEYISPAMSRRMSKTVKMSSVASTKALQDAKISQPDSIIVGTGMGCSQDSEKFLKNIIENNEEFLTPTFFIQSTHNTVAGQIALALQCHGYNFTYVNPSSALEFSLLDAKLQLLDGDANSVLVGSTDEEAGRTMELYQLNETIKKEENIPFEITNSTTKGVIWGEGASFFVLEKDKTENSYAKLKDVEICNEVTLEETSNFINQFLTKNNYTTNEIDVVILGFSGDFESDLYYKEASKQFPNAILLYYKHLSGEFNTSSGFSNFVACNILKQQTIPEIMKLNATTKTTLKNVLLYNHLLGKDHSLVLLEKA